MTLCFLRVAVVLKCAILASPVFAQPQDLPNPLIIAHRGASGLLPEHTLEAYALAIQQGAHFVEPDLVITSDGVLIARHENELSDTTDVASKFPARKATKVVDGREVSGWFAEDFTLAEIRTLTASQRLAFRDQSKNGLYSIPTFNEVLALIQRESKRKGRPIGVYPETKHPSYHQSIELPLEPPLVSALDHAGLSAQGDWVFVQSFEVNNLKDLNKMTEVRLVQLLGFGTLAPYDQAAAGTGVTYADMITDAGLASIKRYADGIGPWKVLIVPQDQDGEVLPPTDLVQRAHRAGLVVHAYTFRDEPQYLAKVYGDDPLDEYRRFFGLGLDGVFTDFPATALGTFDVQD